MDSGSKTYIEIGRKFADKEVFSLNVPITWPKIAVNRLQFNNVPEGTKFEMIELFTYRIPGFLD